MPRRLHPGPAAASLRPRPPGARPGDGNLGSRLEQSRASISRRSARRLDAAKRCRPDQRALGAAPGPVRLSHERSGARPGAGGHRRLHRARGGGRGGTVLHGHSRARRAWSSRSCSAEGLTPARSSLPGVPRLGRWAAVYVAPPREGVLWRASFGNATPEQLRGVRVSVTDFGFPGGEGWQRLPRMAAAGARGLDRHGHVGGAAAFRY